VGPKKTTSNQQELVFLTNHLKFAASTIAAIYKDRWQVELSIRLMVNV
jgi:IS4 transposase